MLLFVIFERNIFQAREQIHLFNRKKKNNVIFKPDALETVCIQLQIDYLWYLSFISFSSMYFNLSPSHPVLPPQLFSALVWST